MRKIVILASLLFVLACNSGDDTSTIASKADSSKVVINYAYTPKEMPNWEMGDPHHVAFVLEAFKKYETGKFDELKKYFADSIWVGDDGLEFNGTSDSLIDIIKKDREKVETVAIEMHDWESVHGKDNKEDWVTVWYKAITKYKDGKIDSAMYVDDIKMENGRMRVIDTKKRRYPARK